MSSWEPGTSVRDAARCSQTNISEYQIHVLTAHGSRITVPAPATVFIGSALAKAKARARAALYTHPTTRSEHVRTLIDSIQDQDFKSGFLEKCLSSLREKCEASLVNCTDWCSNSDEVSSFTTFRDCWGFVWRQEIDQYSPDLGFNISYHNLHSADKVFTFSSTPSVTELGTLLKMNILMAFYDC